MRDPHATPPRPGRRPVHTFGSRAGLLLAGLFAAACQPGADEEASTQQAPGLPERPATVVDTLEVEGMPEPITLELFTWEDSAGLPLSFYVPEGLTPERFAANDGAAVRVAANFTGVPDTAAFLHVYAYPSGTAEETAWESVEGLLTGLQIPVSRGVGADSGTAVTDRFPWALLERSFQMPPTGQPSFIGAIGLGRHGDRFFHVLYRYPPEYGDGMGPRIAAILRTWRWEDTGEMLEGG